MFAGSWRCSFFYKMFGFHFVVVAPTVVAVPLGTWFDAPEAYILLASTGVLATVFFDGLTAVWDYFCTRTMSVSILVERDGGPVYSKSNGLAHVGCSSG